VVDGSRRAILKRGSRKVIWRLRSTARGSRAIGTWFGCGPRSGEKTEPWLLIKSDEAFARDRGDREITDEETTSQLSGRTNEELAATGAIRKDHAARAMVAKAQKTVLPGISKLSGARAGLLPAFLEPSLAASCAKPPSVRSQKFLVIIIGS
jgi:bifunctional non-homologous end joining protein LigD